jgi:hypothetical protein
MRHRRLLSAALVLACASAGAQVKGYDPKGLARYDVSYARCEAKFPEMKGHRDDAYLSLWRVKPDAKSTARLAAIRNEATYKAEKKLAGQEAAKATDPEVVKAFERQCRGLWGEMARMPKSGS